ncbi:hypothetical protein X727_33010 [Mesorhizobium sp. L103C119B0]|uniref:DUF2971 domain-containing protein n=1 Tax=Mesorhizobium sp. L103C119B0 TaxID=1287085 RepID=UPI0003CFA38D|nr:DUF2971 domain-containing protein [Mesorhizobium sp. L103C119B0]ESZ56003.1 hypothetical protein X727_33010 [Mesorhizobium sp. L103C119B0]
MSQEIEMSSQPSQVEQGPTAQQISDRFSPLYEEFQQNDLWMKGERPLLAHYTSVETLEKILKNEELWLSNPLFMNDLDEMRFGLTRGKAFFDQTDLEKTCGLDSATAALLRTDFNNLYSEYESKHALNVYVLCLSMHAADNTDGILSMWRAYANNGAGAAVVFDTGAIKTLIDDSPLVLTQVRYASTADRLQWLERKVADWCAIVAKGNIPQHMLYVPAYWLFHVILGFALSTKHIGFLEEHEWRLIYMPDRDRNKLLTEKFDYIVGSRGVEPKLKLKIAPLDGAISQFSFSEILHSILLGPSISSPLASASVFRMLEKLNKEYLKSKVHSSTIPLRHAWPI